MDWGPPTALRPPLPPPQVDLRWPAPLPADPQWPASAVVTTFAWPPAPERAQRQTRFRLDIEGLRALAVVLVLAYHAELGPFHGGFVGVDVFFVVSGFLITSLLLDELEVIGFITLRRFWARRARRLLPAASLVIVATVVAAVLILDPLTADDVAHDAVAAALFVINMVLARRQTDYLAGNLTPSPLQHFWSLAVEEQFYLLWPVLLQLLTGYRRRPRAIVTAIVVVAWPLSYWACVSLTRTNQPWAFYSLPTRAWELLTGAVLALAAGLVARLPGLFRSLVGWAGLAAIVVAAVDYSTTTIFPGPGALLPVLGTMAVVAGGPSAPWARSRSSGTVSSRGPAPARTASTSGTGPPSSSSPPTSDHCRHGHDSPSSWRRWSSPLSPSPSWRTRSVTRAGSPPRPAAASPSAPASSPSPSRRRWSRWRPRPPSPAPATVRRWSSLHGRRPLPSRRRRPP